MTTACGVHSSWEVAASNARNLSVLWTFNIRWGICFLFLKKKFVARWAELICMISKGFKDGARDWKVAMLVSSLLTVHASEWNSRYHGFCHHITSKSCWSRFHWEEEAVVSYRGGSVGFLVEHWHVILIRDNSDGKKEEVSEERRVTWSKDHPTIHQKGSSRGHLNNHQSFSSPITTTNLYYNLPIWSHSPIQNCPASLTWQKPEEKWGSVELRFISFPRWCLGNRDKT